MKVCFLFYSQCLCSPQDPDLSFLRSPETIPSTKARHCFDNNFSPLVNKVNLLYGPVTASLMGEFFQAPQPSLQIQYCLTVFFFFFLTHWISNIRYIWIKLKLPRFYFSLLYIAKKILLRVAFPLLKKIISTVPISWCTVHTITLPFPSRMWDHIDTCYWFFFK